MQRYVTLLAIVLATCAAQAQTARQEIEENPFLYGSNHLDYNHQLPQ